MHVLDGSARFVALLLQVMAEIKLRTKREIFLVKDAPIFGVAWRTLHHLQNRRNRYTPLLRACDCDWAV